MKNLILALTIFLVACQAGATPIPIERPATEAERSMARAKRMEILSMSVNYCICQLRQGNDFVTEKCAQEASGEFAMFFAPLLQKLDCEIVLFGYGKGRDA